MLAEDLRLSKRQETLHIPCWAKEIRKNVDKRIGMGPLPLGGSCEGGSFHTLGNPCTGRDSGWVGGGKPLSYRGECRNRGAEGKAERFLHKGSVLTSTHQPDRIFCSPAGAGRGWELRLQLWRSDPRENTEVGCMNKA